MLNEVVIIESLLSKLSSYELLNYVFLGTLSLILGYTFNLTYFIKFYNTLKPMDTFIQGVAFFVISYFFGLTISRIGSLISILFVKDTNQLINKKCCFCIESAPYEDYVEAEKKDEKIVILTSHANLYRSLVGLFLLLTILLFLETFFPTLLLSSWFLGIFLFAFLIMFIIAWKQQVNYVRRRVKKTLGSSNVDESDV